MEHEDEFHQLLHTLVSVTPGTFEITYVTVIISLVDCATVDSCIAIK